MSRRTFMAVGGGAIASAAFGAGPRSGGSLAHASPVVTAPGGDWLHLAVNQTSILDDWFLAFLLEHHEGVGFRAPLHALDGPGVRFDYDSVVRRIKELRPDMPVLMYTDAAQFRKSNSSLLRIEQHVLEGYEDLGELLVPEWPQGSARQYFGDPRNPEFRMWLTQRISKWTADMGCDGAFVDLCHMEPNRFSLDPEGTIAYRQGMQQLLVDIGDALEDDSLVMFNGLWPDEIRPGMLDRQLQGLPHANAAMIEYFGWDPFDRGGRGPVPIDLTPFLPIAAQFPDTTLMFSGRGIGTYEDYEADYLRQRYDYVAYLLAANENSFFKYNATFQQPGGDTQRTGNEAVFRDWLIDIGAPQEEYQVDDGLYTRRFTEGLVAWNPQPGGTGESRTLWLRQPMFDPEGRHYYRQVTVQPGVGLLLFDRPHRPRPISRIDLGDADAPGGDWDAAQRHGNYLHLDRTPAAQEYQHDLMLDPIRSLTAPLGLAVRMRTDDPDARLDIVVEVDDTQAADNRTIISVDTEAAPLGTPPARVAANPFRATTQTAAGYSNRAAFPANVAIKADGEWHTVRVDVPQILSAAGGRYTPHRLVHMRLIGTMDVRTILITPAAKGGRA